ncbi:hypothetical protein RJ639_045602, partial [Escallonia herrerae]
ANEANLKENLDHLDDVRAQAQSNCAPLSIKQPDTTTGGAHYKLLRVGDLYLIYYFDRKKEEMKNVRMPNSSPAMRARQDECTLPEDPPQLLISKAPDPWNLYVDGSSAVASSGVGIILISPEGFVVEYALRFGFQALNNEAEYEALLAGIRLVHALKVDSLSVHNDSQLVVNHVLGDYEARDEQMAQYLQLVKTSASKFKNFTIRQIPRD